MKLGIVTINDYTNYGNRLQNYALTTLLKNEGCEVINNIEIYTKENWINNTKSIVKKTIKKVIPFCMISKKVYSPKKHIKEIYREREQKFRNFSNSYSETIKPVVASNYKEIQCIFNKIGIDNFIVGSDQVWNPHFAARDYQFLAFAPKKMRYSFAASIGISSLPEDKKEYYKKYLSEMEYLSVREEKAAEIIYDLTGKNADITLDPTLLLSKNEWDKIVKKPTLCLEDEYICTYFLGEIPKAVKLFAEKKNIIIYQLNSLENKELFALNPAEFLFMIKNAKYVLTDSFHAVAFSIKFHKEFYVFRREQLGVENMFSRIETILKRFGLENKIQDRDEIKETVSIIDWKKIDDILEFEREKSINKLFEVMEL